MEESKKLLEKVFAKLDELSDRHKDDEESMAFLEKMTIYVKEKAEDDALNYKEKDLSLDSKYFSCLDKAADKFETNEESAWEDFRCWLEDDFREREEDDDDEDEED